MSAPRSMPLFWFSMGRELLQDKAASPPLHHCVFVPGTSLAQGRQGGRGSFDSETVPSPPFPRAHASHFPKWTKPRMPMVINSVAHSVDQSHPTLCDPWIVACQAPLSRRLSRPAYWSELLCPPPGDLPSPRVEPRSPTLQADSLPSDPAGKPQSTRYVTLDQLAPFPTLDSPLFCWSFLGSTPTSATCNGLLFSVSALGGAQT